MLESSVTNLAGLAGVTGIAADVHAGKTSAESVTLAALDQIAKYNGELNAFLEVPREGALAQARAIDAKRARGEALGPLAGLPGAIKDAICVRGVATTAASKILAGYEPPYDSA